MRDQQALIAAYHAEFRRARTVLEAALQELTQSASVRQELEAQLPQAAPPAKAAGLPKLLSGTLQRLQAEISQCEIRIQAAQQQCSERLQAAQVVTAQLARQRDQAYANIQNLLKHLRNGSHAG